MSLGNSYDNNKKNNVFEPTVYSQYKMSNVESNVDKTTIAFHFWNNSLKISIFPMKANVSEGQVAFDYDNGISIYLNHTKARILAEEFKKFLSDPVMYDNSGVPSGQGLITISRGTEFGSSSPVIVIRKVDENGGVSSSFAYQIKEDYHFSVRNYSENGNFEKHKEDYRNLEILQIITLLEEFYKASSSAIAYSVYDQFKFEHNRQREWRNSVSAKLGIEIPGGNGGSRNYSSTSFFNNSSGSNTNGPSSVTSGSTGYTRASLDDID